MENSIIDHDINGEEVYMTPKKMVECAKCGQEFKALGRHKKVCKGTLIVNSKEWDDAVDNIMSGFDALKKLFMDSQGEALVYKRERDEMAEWRGRVKNLMKGVDLDKP